MPSHVYRAEVKANHIVNAGLTPAADSATSADITHHAYFVMVSDTAPTYWAIHAELYSNNTATEFTTVFRFKWWDGQASFNPAIGATTTDDPETWPLVFDHDPSFPGGYLSIQQVVPAGDNGAVFFAGGTFAVEKDEAMNEVRFITPFGTTTMPLADPTNARNNFNAQNDRPLFFRGHGHHMHIPFGVNVTKEATVEWEDAVDLTDGAPTFTIAMSTGDPGTWGPDRTAHSLGFPEGVSVGGCGAGVALANIGNSQLATRYRMQWTHILADDTPNPRFVCNVWFRYRILLPSPNPTLDAVVDPATGILLYATVRTDGPKRVSCFFSTDDGHMFGEGTVDYKFTGDYTYPSITISPNGLVYIFYLGDVTNKLFYGVSTNKGKTFAPPQFLTVLNPPMDRPKARFHPVTGILYLFYYDSSTTNTYLQRIDEVGVSAIDGSAVLVRAAATGPYDIYFDANGLIFVGTRDVVTGDRVVVFSRNMGTTWEDWSLGDFTVEASLSQVTTQDPLLGLGLTAYQADDLNKTLIAYLTDDDGLTRIANEATIFTGLEKQEFGCVNGTNHQFYVIFFTGAAPSLMVECYIARDLGQVWVAA